MPAAARSRATRAAGAVEPNETGVYRVVILGASYKLPGKPNGNRFARKGELIELDDQEAERLLGLGAIVPDGEADPVPPGLPDGFGGVAQESLEEHAKKAKAKARGK